MHSRVSIDIDLDGGDMFHVERDREQYRVRLVHFVVGQSTATLYAARVHRNGSTNKNAIPFPGVPLTSLPTGVQTVLEARTKHPLPLNL